MSEDLLRIDPEWIKKQSDSEARKEARKEKRKKVHPDDQEEYSAGRGVKILASIFIGLGLVMVAIGFIGFCYAFIGAGWMLGQQILASGIIMVAGIVTALSALLYYCFGVMVVKSVENTRNTTQMLALMKQMMRMMEQQGSSAAPDENGPQHAEKQAD